MTKLPFFVNKKGGLDLITNSHISEKIRKSVNFVHVFDLVFKTFSTRLQFFCQYFNLDTIKHKF